MENQTDPIVIQTGQQTSGGFTTPLSSNLPKILFIILSLVIVGELIWGVWYLTKPRSIQVKNTGSGNIIYSTVSEEKPGVQVKLQSDNSQINVGDNVSVDVALSGNADDIVGMDLVLKYDPTFLTLAGTPPLFGRGNTFPEYLGESIDKTAGIFSISGTSVTPLSIEGNTIFGTLNFKALKPGNTLIQISFEPGSTTETNILQDITGTDVIDKIGNLSVKII